MFASPVLHPRGICPLAPGRRVSAFLASLGTFAFLLVAPLFLSAAPVAAAPAVTRTLPNGLTVVFEHRAGAPVTAVQLWVRAGGADEEERTLGLAHYLEHMLFKGTTSRPVGSIHEEVEKNGGEINAATSDDWTYYHVTIAAEEWRRALGIITDIAVNASFPVEEFDREREVIKEELARRDDNPMALLWDHLGRAAFTVHPYRFRVIGSETSLQAITREKMIAFYRAHYVPGKMALVLVGDFDTTTAWTDVVASLGRVSGRPRALTARTQEPPRRRSRMLSVEATAQRGYGAIAVPGPAARDLSATAAGDVLAGLLTGDGIGRWTRRLVEDARVADMLSVSLQTNRDPGLFTAFFSADPARRAEAEDEIRRAMTGLKWERFDAAEVDAAARQILRDRAERMQEASGAAFEHGFWYAVGVPGGGDRYAAAVAAVTPDDLAAFTARYVTPAPSVTVSLLPRPVASRHDEDGPGSELSLIYRRTDDELAAFGIFLEGGQASEPEPGWAAALAGVMNRGVAGRTYAEFSRDLARAGMTLAASSAADLIHVIASGAPDRSGQLIGTAFDVVERPNVDDLAVVRENLADALASRVDNPFNISLDRLAALRFGDHPYGRPEAGTSDGLASLSPSRLREWRDEVGVRSRARFVYVGSAPETEVRSAVARRLAAWKEGERFVPPAIPRAISRALAETAVTNQAIVLRSYAAPAMGDASYPAWKIANAILGGRSSSRLFKVVREERGLAYAVGSFFPTRRQSAHLVFYAGTRPANSSQVRALWNDVLKAPTAAELEDAKKLVRGEFALDHEKVARRAWYLGWYETLGLGADFDAAYPDRLDAVSLEDVVTVFDALREAAVVDYVRGGAL